MLAPPFADSFLAGSVLTIALPLGLLVAIGIWYLVAVRRVPADTPVSSPALPPDEVVDAAGPAVVADITLEADVTPIDDPVDEA
jgi:hypothetical protein